MAATGPPTAFPIKSLEQLRNRSYFDSPDFSFNKSSVPLPPSCVTSREKRPRLLACHDLQGGYGDDKWIQGGGNADSYILTRWRLLDSFVYFSHNLVTLPPPGWTNAAHLHGVQVLGTFITEWAEGAKVCQELLATEESARMYADHLAELAQALGFDGWLVNIENPIEWNKVGVLQKFVRHLTESTHALVPQSLVIWYDSVTVDGLLNWQDQLNNSNKPFFDVCDGIFTNYVWQQGYPKLSASLAGDRAHDVYMGVDVFGRNTFGGGGFHCDVALKVAREAGVSAALFAPGWSYELKQDQSRWWESIEDCWPPARPDPFRLPFFTDFDVGHGRTKFVDGKQVSALPWNNLSCQNLQPLWEESTQHHVIVCPRKGPAVYSGGVSMKVTGVMSIDEVRVVQLFQTEATIDETSLNVSYSVTMQGASKFCLAMLTQDPENKLVFHFLLDTEEKHMTSSAQSYPYVSAVFHRANRNYSKGSEIASGRKLETVASLESGVPSDTIWSIRDCTVEWKPSTLTGIFGICSIAEDLKPILMKLLQNKEFVLDMLTMRRSNKQPSVISKLADRAARNESNVITGRRVLDDSNRQSISPGKAVSGNQPWYKSWFTQLLTNAKNPTPSKTNDPNFSANLGHISITPSNHEHWTFSETKLSGQDPLWTFEADGVRALSINLTWALPCTTSESSTYPVQRYLLYVNSGDEGELSNSSGLTYLGMTMLNAFYVNKHPVPSALTSVTFHLHRQCGCGKVLTLSKGGTYTFFFPT